MQSWIRALRKGFAYLQRHSLLMPTLVAFVCFVGSVLLILSVFFTRSVTSTLEDTMVENATQSSLKAAGQLQLNLQDINNIASHLKQVDALSPNAFLASSYDAYQTLQRYDYSTFKYSNLAFFYQRSPMLLTVKGTCYPEVCFPEVDDPDALMAEIRQAASVTLLSTAAFGAPWEDSRLLLLYPMNSQYTAVFFFNHALLSATLAPAAAQGDSLQVIFGRDGAVLFSSRPIEEDAAARLFARTRAEDSDYRLTHHGTAYIASSSAVSYGLTLVMLEEITTQFDRLDAVTNMLILVCCVILLLGAGLLWFSVRQGYMPIANLVRDLNSVLPEQQDAAPSDIATLRHAYSQYSLLLQESQKNAALFSSDQLRSLFVLRTISGRSTDAEELTNLCRQLHIDFPHPCFFACLIAFDRMQGEQARKQVEEQLHRITQPLTACYCLLPDGRSAVGIINVPSTDAAQLPAFGAQTLRALPPELHATMGMGQIYADIASIGKSYLEAHAALDWRLIKGKNTWITYDEIHFSSAAPAYPRQLIDGYVTILRTWDVQGIRGKLQQIADYIHQNSLPLQQVKCICYDLTSAFLREISALDNHVTYKLSASYDVFTIAEYDSVSELVQKIADLSEAIRLYIAKREEHQSGDLVSQCMSYLQSNIANAQFSLSSCSEQFHIAPQTLRRKFKEATGQTLSSTMTALRIARAKELLTTTRLDISEICTRCGYLDQSSFIRLFKAEAGVSPGKFRELHGREI